MDRERLRLLGETVRTFLLSKKSREVFVFIFFFIVSAGFWLLQTLNDTYDTTLRLHLRLQNVPDGVIITTGLPECINISVRDKGTTLMRYYVEKATLGTVDLDFQAYDRGASSSRAIVPHADVMKSIAPLLEPSTRVVGIRPDTVEFFFSRGVKKRVPVLFKGRVETDPLYYLADLRCDPDTVTVWGDKQELDTLAAVPTVPKVLSGISENTSQKVQLRFRKGMKYEPQEVMLTATVDVYTQKQVEVPIVGTNFPAGVVLRTFPSTATISFRVGAKDFKNVTADNFVITATYEELMELPDSILPLSLRSVPAGVSQVRIHPESVQFLIEQTED